MPMEKPAKTPLRIGRIEKQVSLPLSRAFAIALKSIMIRFWRSMITASGVVLAIAFLMSGVGRDVMYRNYARQLSREGMAGGPTPEWVSHAKLFLQRQGVTAAQDRTHDTSSEAAAQERRQGARRTWIIVMSLAVCFLGIINAQLMSVSERFREIGTMKCLGALDGFVVSIFVIESLLQGFIGSVLGMIVGLILTLLQVRIAFGAGALSGFPFLQILGWIGVVLAVGTCLSIAAAVAPAVRAAKMVPADAMRTEE